MSVGQSKTTKRILRYSTLDITREKGMERVGILEIGVVEINSLEECKVESLSTEDEGLTGNDAIFSDVDA